MVTIAVVIGNVNGMPDDAPTSAPTSHAAGKINKTARPN
jgi:hypothetical protein